MPAVTAARTAVVSIGGDDVYEDLFGVGNALQNLLTSLGYSTSLRIGMGWLDGEAPALVVLYSAMGQLDESRMTRLLEAVDRGTGVLVVHSTAVLPMEGDLAVPPFDRAFDLFGSRYGSHGPQPHSSIFTVHLDPDHPITAGIQPFDIDHEHYELVPSSPVTVVAWREAPYGREPIMHVREHGAGRVCYLQLGHDTRAFDEPGVRALVGGATRWLDRSSTREGH